MKGRKALTSWFQVGSQRESFQRSGIKDRGSVKFVGSWARVIVLDETYMVGLLLV